MAAVARRSVKVIMLGRMGFIPAFDIQTRYARAHLDEMAGRPNAHGEDTLLLVEHTPVYTVGVRNKHYTPEDVNVLKSLGAEFYTTNRGGLITFHGPGQLVAYPILNLTRFKPSMKWYVSQLEQTLLATLHQFDLKGRLTDQTGVWVDDRKIASIGLHGSRYVTTHGIGLNCATNLSWFRYVVPCGLPGVEMTSLTKELATDVSIQDATSPFLKAFQDVFNCDLEYGMLENHEASLLNHSSLSTSATTSTSSSSVDPAESSVDKNVTSAASTTTTADDNNNTIRGNTNNPSGPTTSSTSPVTNTSDPASLPKVDPSPRIEVGVRQMSTLSSSSSSPSPSPSSLFSSSSSTSSSSSSSSSFSSSSNPNNSPSPKYIVNTSVNQKVVYARPGIVKRRWMPPMW